MAIIGDDLVNLVTGLGTAKDKRSYTEFQNNQLDRNYLGTLYRNWLFGKIVDIPADDMTRKWRKPIAPSLEIDEIEKFEKFEKELKVRAKVNEALKWARLYGGSAIIMNVNDGLGALSDPLEVSRVKEGSLESLIVVDRWDLNPYNVNTTDVEKNYRLPEYYSMHNGEKVHYSRIIRFDGYKLPWDEFQKNNFWGGSIAERVYDECLNTKITTQSISSLIFEASIDVISVKDLFDAVMSKQRMTAILKRFELANLTKSINRALIIDQDNETFTKQGSNFSGLPNLISEYLSVVAAAADIPATRMLGQSAKGFSATGEGDLKNYYDMISSKQETDLYDALGKLDAVLVPSILGRPVDDWDFEFNPLQQMTEREIAEINKMDIESAKIAYESGVITLSHWSAQLLEKGVYPTLDSEWVSNLELMEEEEAKELAAQTTEPVLAMPFNQSTGEPTAEPIEDMPFDGVIGAEDGENNPGDEQAKAKEKDEI